MVRKIVVFVLCFVAGCMSCPVLLVGGFIGCSQNPRNAAAVVTDWGKYIFCVNDLSRQHEFGFIPTCFDMTNTNVVYKIKFCPRFPQPHEVLVVCPHDGTETSAGLFMGHRPLFASVTVRHQGQAQVHWTSWDAEVVVLESAKRTEWRIGSFDPGLFPWWYKEEIEIEVSLLSPVDQRYTGSANGALVLRSILPFE